MAGLVESGFQGFEFPLYAEDLGNHRGLVELMSKRVIALPKLPISPPLGNDLLKSRFAPPKGGVEENLMAVKLPCSIPEDGRQKYSTPSKQQPSKDTAQGRWEKKQSIKSDPALPAVQERKQSGQNRKQPKQDCRTLGVGTCSSKAREPMKHHRGNWRDKRALHWQERKSYPEYSLCQTRMGLMKSGWQSRPDWRTTNGGYYNWKRQVPKLKSWRRRGQREDHHPGLNWRHGPPPQYMGIVMSQYEFRGRHWNMGCKKRSGEDHRSHDC